MNPVSIGNLRIPFFFQPVLYVVHFYGLDSVYLGCRVVADTDHFLSQVSEKVIPEPSGECCSSPAPATLFCCL